MSCQPASHGSPGYDYLCMGIAVWCAAITPLHESATGGRCLGSGVCCSEVQPCQLPQHLLPSPVITSAAAVHHPYRATCAAIEVGCRAVHLARDPSVGCPHPRPIISSLGGDGAASVWQPWHTTSRTLWSGLCCGMHALWLHRVDVCPACAAAVKPSQCQLHMRCTVWGTHWLQLCAPPRAASGRGRAHRPCMCVWPGWGG